MMEETAKSKVERMAYCSKVWVSSVLIGPLLWFVCLGMDTHLSVGEFFQFWIGCSGLALLFSFPSFILLARVVKRVEARSRDLPRKRLVVALWAVGLAFLAAFLVFVPVRLLFNYRDQSFLNMRLLIGVLCFVVPLVVGVYFFRWPANANG